MLEIEQTQVPGSWQKCLDELARGESVVVTNDNVPIAEFRPLSTPSKKPRPIGLGVGLGTIEPNAFDPLPEDLLALFNCEKP